MGSFLDAMTKFLGARRKTKPQTEDRIFDPRVRAKMKAAHSGRIAGGKAGYQGFGAPPGAEDVAYAQGGAIPSRFRKMAQKQKTSIPRGGR